MLLPVASYAQTDLENYFNLCLEFGAPQEVVQLYQPFRTYKSENNGSISYVAQEDNSLIKDKPYSEYQIWYTIDKDQGLYQSTLIIRGDKPLLQGILTGYLKKFNDSYGEPVYTNLDNGSLLIFWYNETTFTVKARLLLDIANSYKFISITFCSPLARHINLLKTLYNGTPDSTSDGTPNSDLESTSAGEQIPGADNNAVMPADEAPAPAADESGTESAETGDKQSIDKAGVPDNGVPPDNQDGTMPENSPQE